jgi:16S rRNA (uracil1498-N3)-methyltransferase
MQYLYHPDASAPQLELTGDTHRYLFKVRRHRAGEVIALRNLQDGVLYSYLIETMDKKTALLSLQTQQHVDIAARHRLHIGWCMIDPKSIEKSLPSLNESGVDRITFIYCERSQKQFRLDFDRLEKILLNSSQQSGRSQQMQLASVDSMEAFVMQYPQSYLLHFSEQNLSKEHEIETIVVGCEGGLTDAEIKLFDPEKIVGLDTPLILRSESAVVAAASKLLL